MRPPASDKHSSRIHHRQPTLCREVDKPCGMLSDERACQDNDTIRTPLARRGECTLEIVEPSYLQALDLEIQHASFGRHLPLTP